jgi:hypothetical protein
MAPVDYTFYEDDTCGLASTTAEPICKLDPDIDSGWLIARHHRGPEAFNGYVIAVIDLGDDENSGTSLRGFQTKEGFFTLLQRPAAKRRPEHLFVCALKEWNDQHGWVERCKIVHPDGHTTQDDGILFSPD